MNKKWSKMSDTEKLEALLEWAAKTHEALEETREMLNKIITHLNEYNGQAFPWLKKPKKIIES